MDELVRHCLREIAFDGDLGCDVSRLRDFISGFYSHSSSQEQGQNVDGAFCAFVWSVIVQQPGIRVGTVLEGVSTEVYIAPQSRANKAKGKGKDTAAAEESAPGLIVIEDAAIRPLEDLRQQYGDALRIAAHPETTFAALTGSHIRPSKLTPMIYTALQIITRGRDDGVSNVDLGNKSGYDSKTCFYIVKQLLHLNLVVKLPQPGVSTNLIVNKYFYERSPIWRQVRIEEKEAVSKAQPKEDSDSEEEDDGEETKPMAPVHFDAMSSRHLSSMPLLKSRLTKLLKACPSNMHTSNNLLVKIGFANPSKPDRLFFRKRIRALIDEGFIEKVQVPHADRRRFPDKKVLCLRLLAEDATSQLQGETIPVVEDTSLEDIEVYQPPNDHTGLKANASLHKQILDCLADAGTTGMTLNELSASLGDFDRRTIDLLLSRLEKDPPPAHLADLGVAQLIETSGRERRYKYYTIAHYMALAEKENFAERRYRDTDMSVVGGFRIYQAEEFYQTEEELDRHIRLMNITKGAASSSKNGSVKKGRPKKSQVVRKDREIVPASARKGKKRKREDSPKGDALEGGDAAKDDEPPPKRRGRLSKTPAVRVVTEGVPLEASQPFKKRGRPPKNAASVDQPPTITPGPTSESPEAAVAASKKRGRPKKLPELTIDAAPTHGEDVSILEAPLSPLSSLPSPSLPANLELSTHDAVPPDPIRTEAETELENSMCISVSSQTIAVVEQGSSNNTVISFLPVGVSDHPEHATIPIDPSIFASDQLSRQSLISMTPVPDVFLSDAMIPHKRNQPPDTLSEEPLTKRTKSSDHTRSRTKGNLSQPRRENEILRLLAEVNGIINTNSKEIYEAHAALVEKMVAAGEPVSSRVGARIDKRTLDATLKELELKGKIKLLTTSAPTLTGSMRLTRIAYLPETATDAVNSFLAELSQQLYSAPSNPPAITPKTLEEPLDYGGSRKKASGRARPSVVATQSQDDDVQEINLNDLEMLFQQNDQKIHDLLLTEKHTVAQLYGYLVGKAARARSLHLATVALLGQDAPSTQIVSKEHRIIHISYYFTDIPISIYCSLVAILQPNEELVTLLRSPEGQDTPVGGVSDSLRAALAASHSKSRARILSLLDLLQALGLVTPLIPSDSDTPAFSCTDNPQYASAFDVAPLSAYTPATAPSFWRFNDSAPIHLWAIGEGAPPVWKTASISEIQEATSYWNDLQSVCTDPFYAQQLLGALPASAGPASEETIAAVRSLRRAVSWSAAYNLSFYQTEYLRRYIDPATSNTPLEDEDAARRDALLNRLSWIVSASREVIVSWFEKTRKKHIRDLKKVKKAATQKAAAGENAAAVVARRAAEAKEQREIAWQAMVERVHPGELRQSAAQRINRIKTKFLHSSAKPSDKWEARILEAIKEADLVAEKLLSTAHPLFVPMPFSKFVLPTPVPVGLQEKDVDDLIASQGPRVPQNSRTGKKAKKGKAKAKDAGEAEVMAPRRHRFLWTRDYDELVRDASVIIEGRCRGTRKDWGALEQIFPAVPRNSVRLRLNHLKGLPGAETYLTRLQDRWYDLWVQHRGTDVLPDPDPTSATKFDLATHVKFLRKHIDKNAIRVGFVEAQNSQRVDLPASIEDIKQHYEIIEKEPSAPNWDFMWSVVAEEAREKQFAHQAFVGEIDDMPPAHSYQSELLYVADTAVKMVLGNPKETYNEDVASRLLKGVGAELADTAKRDLLQRGVLAKLVRDPNKTMPGRTMKISDSNYNSLGGQMHRELFQDASALEELIAQQQGNGSDSPSDHWQEWSLLATDGDTAFLLELASENKVRFDVDTTHSRSMRSIIDWNSKKADDDDIETAIRVQYQDLSRNAVSELSADPPNIEVVVDVDVEEEHTPCEHGTSADGGEAFCRRSSEGLINCQGCLQEAMKSLFQKLNGDERTTLDKIMTALDDAGSIGLPKQAILEKSDLRSYEVHTVIRHMTESPVPLAYWTGFNTMVLVSSSAIRKWTVIVNNADDEPPISEIPVSKSMIFPRRWLDIYGRRLDDVWESALRAILGLVLLHTGISQAEIRWRLRSTYNRQEVCELLQTLLEEGYITARVDAVHVGPIERVFVDDREEKYTFWFLNAERRWYQV